MTLDALVKSRKPNVDNLLVPIRKVLPSPFQDATNVADLAGVSLLIIDDFGIRKLPHMAPEDLREPVMRRFKRATLLPSNPRGLRIGGISRRTPPRSRRFSPAIVTMAVAPELAPHRVSY